MTAMLRSRNDVSSMRSILVMLRDFLSGVAKGDRQACETFFADDVIYTGSTGRAMDKSQVMKMIGSDPNGSKAIYRAEDITVHPYENMAVLNFRMVVDNDVDGYRETSYFRHTGTFLKRSGRWQVVAWHATEITQGEHAE